MSATLGVPGLGTPAEVTRHGPGSLWAFALRLLWRERRSGALRLLAASLALAVAALSSVGFFADRVRQALNNQSHQLLGADLLLLADHPWSDEDRAQARSHNLNLAETISFQSMASAGESVHLSDVKAVSDGYPLRGSLRIAEGRGQPDRVTRDVPARGRAWVDERLLVALGLAVGDSLQLGATQLEIGAMLTLEPDRGINFFGIAPRLMIRIEDLPATGLLQTGSRVRYRLLVAGQQESLDRFSRQVTPTLSRGQNIEGVDGARPEIRAALDRAERFLGLAALLTVMLCAVAISLGVRRYMQGALDSYAVMRCLGAQQSTLLHLVLRQFFVLALVFSALGVLLGFAAHGVLGLLLGQLLEVPLPLPGWQPALQGMLVGFLLLGGLVVPRIVQLKRVPSLRVLRRELGLPEQGVVAAYGVGVVALFALMLWIAGDLTMTALIAGGFLLAAMFFLGLSYVAWRFAAVLGVLRSLPFIVRRGLVMVGRRPLPASLQASALALGFMALLLLTVTRGELISAWENATPPDAPNRFVVNIQPDQVPAVAEFLKSAGVIAELQPMVRGRLSQINGQAVGEGDYANERAQRLVSREFNLSWRPDIPEGNHLAGGRWFSDSDRDRPVLSVESGLAKTLGLSIGDTLRFEIAGEPVDAEVVGLRRLKWDSMRVNFFVIFSPGVIERYPASYIVSYRAPEARANFTGELVQRFPNLTVIDVSVILAQLRSITDQVIAAVQFLFMFALFAGLAVLYGAFSLAFDERRHELSVMRALGAEKRVLAGGLRVEFAAIGAVAGFLAAISAMLVGSVLAREVFDLPLSIQWWLPVLSALVGAMAIMLAGSFSVSQLLRIPPLTSLRNVE